MGTQGPTGNVTLVFTDIQDSSRMWEKHGRAFEPVLALHNQVLRQQIALHEGYEVKTEGDAFMVAFADPDAALRFCLDTQQALAQAPWPAAVGEVRVRMGAHSGEPICNADPRTGHTDYFGPVVNRAARVASAGHGGQVLLSESTFRRAQAAAAQALVTDMGQHLLRGLEQPEHLYQALPQALAGREFPPLHTATALPTNLPPQASTFVGRAGELAELCELLAPRAGRHGGTSPGTKLMRAPGGVVSRDASRLVSMIGPGGTGKTRLAVRAGYEVLDRFEGGVWFVDLSAATDAATVASTVAAALGARPSGKEEPVQAVANVLQYRKPALLILDNFEQVAAHAATTVGLWRQRAPHVSFLVTSRAVLGLQGEQQYELAPLQPPPRHPTARDLANLAAFESVALFVERARESDPRFELGPDNAADVCAICAELDGLPLALELAASRVRMLKPAQMVKRLGRKFELLKSSRRDLSARQQTMYGAIEWGFELLSEWERAAFVQACVFHEGFLLEAAEAVIDLAGIEGAPDVLDALQSLREKSLLRAVEGDHETRFLMYRPILEFGRERWQAEANAQARHDLALRHARHFAEFAWHWGSRVEGPEELDALDHLEADRENIAAAIETAAANGEPELAAKGALGLWELLLVRGPVEMRARVLDAALAANPAPRWRARLLGARSRAQQEVGQQQQAVLTAEQALAAARESGDDVALCEALVQQASANWYIGRYGPCLESAAQARSLAEKLKGPPLLARALGIQAIGFIQTGRVAEAAATLKLAEQTCRDIGYRRGIAHNVANQGILLGRDGQREGALKLYLEAERIYEEIGYTVGVGRMVGNRGAQFQRGGDLAAAQACYERAVQIGRDLGAKQAVASNMSNLSSIISIRGDAAGARRILDECLQTYREIGHPQGEAEILARLGREEIKAKRFESCLAYADKALAMFRELGDTYNGDDTAVECLVALYNLKNYPEMARRAEQLLAFCLGLGNDRVAGTACCFLARARIRMGEAAAARASVTQMHAHFERIKQPPAFVRVDWVFFSAVTFVDALESGSLELARELAREALALRQRHSELMQNLNADGQAALARAREFLDARATPET